MNNIINKIKERAIEIAEELELEIIDVEWVNEFGTNILRIIADSKESLNIDQATALNEAMSLELDKLDLIEDEYMLEVSSPGIERELKTEKDFNRAIDKYIYIKTYQKIDNAFGLKEINGYLKEVLDEEYVVEVLHMGRRKVVNIQKSAVAKIRLAVKF
jgi:ribosome maturation factor RimP